VPDGFVVHCADSGLIDSICYELFHQTLTERSESVRFAADLVSQTETVREKTLTETEGVRIQEGTDRLRYVTYTVDCLNRISPEQLISRLHHDYRLTSLIANHNLSFARRCYRVLRLQRGVIEEATRNIAFWGLSHLKPMRE
jgi:hypothetical protein